jgi:hypothetical protein
MKEEEIRRASRLGGTLKAQPRAAEAPVMWSWKNSVGWLLLMRLRKDHFRYGRAPPQHLLDAVFRRTGRFSGAHSLFPPPGPTHTGTSPRQEQHAGMEMSTDEDMSTTGPSMAA